MEGSVKGGDKRFTWGKKRVTGGGKTGVEFYESCIYDGVEYCLYDCVLTTASFVGKIIKMWEHNDKRENSRKVELLWFFRYSEIPLHFERVQDAFPNELFLGSGTGVGLTNENPVETICGKCNVLCISKDLRNHQPSDEEIKLADFLFYRTLDVGTGRISEKIDDKIAGVDVKFIFNRTSVEKNASAVQKAAFPEVRSNKDPGRCDGGLDHCIRPGSRRNDWDRKDQESEVEKKTSGQKARLAEERFSTDSYWLDDSPQKKRKLDGSIAVADVRVKSRLGEERCSRNSDEMLQKKRELDGLSDRRIKVSQKARQDDRKDREPIRSSRDHVNAGEVYSKKPSHTDKKQDLRIPRFSEGKETGHATEKDPFKKPNSDTQSKLTEGKRRIDADYRRNYRVFEVTQKPKPVESKWYRDRPLDETLRCSEEQGNVVLLRNLDPTYTSKEVEDCRARMIERTSATIPHIGEALVLFKTSDAAERAIRRLNEGCLLLSNGRILVASNAKVNSPEPPLRFTGHIKPRAQRRQNMINAVATSHSSQANTIEYEMGMEWCLHRDRNELSWKRLFEKQTEEMKKLHINFKRKMLSLSVSSSLCSIS